MTEHVVIYTDGACKGNPGPGGWGAILRFRGVEKEISGYEPHTTNNRMELMAAIEALAMLSRPCDVVVVTDSQYLRLGITQWMAQWLRNGWRTSDKKPVKNSDLWLRLHEIAGKHAIQWEWVKGHAGHPDNERADRLANAAIEQLSGREASA